jgi:uncharacterized protein
MDLILLLLLLLGSFIAGLLGSMLGIGGGLIIVPLLNLGFGYPLNQASGASLIAVIVTSSAGATYYVEQKIVNVRLGMLLEVFTVTGAIFGAFTSNVLQQVSFGESSLRILLGIVLVYAAYYMTVGRGSKTSHSQTISSTSKGFLGDIPGAFRDEASGKEVSYTARNIPRGVLAAIGAGVLSGLFGIGGGLVKVPAMILWMEVPTKVATATSNFMIGVTGTAGAAIYYTTGSVLPSIVAPVTIGVFAGAMLGSRISSRVKSVWLSRIFAVVLVATAVELVLRALGISSF